MLKHAWLNPTILHGADQRRAPPHLLSSEMSSLPGRQASKQASKNPSDLKILLSLYLLSLSPLMIPLCVFDGSSNSSSQLALWLSHQNLERQLHASSLPIKSCLNMPGSTLLFFMELINEEHLRIYYLVKCHHRQGTQSGAQVCPLHLHFSGSKGQSDLLSKCVLAQVCPLHLHFSGSKGQSDLLSKCVQASSLANSKPRNSSSSSVSTSSSLLWQQRPVRSTI